MGTKKYTKDDIKTLLIVSATTFSIFVSLGSAVSLILSKGNELTVSLFTNSLWLIGVGINWLVLLYPLFLFTMKKEPHDALTSLAFFFLIISYFVIILALIFFTQIVIKSTP